MLNKTTRDSLNQKKHNCKNANGSEKQMNCSIYRGGVDQNLTIQCTLTNPNQSSSSSMKVATGKKKVG